ncbi:hypothetical protein B0A58_06830 [Flavobacterium branchiophilum NBRC 15030 = ATCC 35035]|uniref:Uncharacterized protein n=2 Tax=Flavobacterium branchiophilum TaxID=55197 RepID=G2Z242_FLABF|nr:DUF6095 family protein [Flavobacterium branchiophilum]OXA76747.1 hypothetical protein B0A58_06830 [Flavobacterium branchiophilum NBRC 15030 = ATCC 35035]PDS24939.1 hypothetical protein B0A77_06690 [Flavobacterium branchiophilum]TQM39237.1 hypothetical protein BC670_0010 [Flavobacterium branchiophilum]CCB69993.1 Probable transmembrane protein of unknown function [Flavobacterium branchiophilum FL-15]GEM54127.1 membrane protein [Flavobacterium branchiophilum NBRC 15030 = ATCC 35035]
MAINKKLLSKGIQYLSGALPLFFIGPFMIYNALMNKQNPWHYLILGLGILCCGISMWLMAKGLKKVVDGIFEEKS